MPRTGKLKAEETSLEYALQFFSALEQWQHDDERLWIGEMIERALREHLDSVYPPSVFPTQTRDDERDFGPMAVSELRKIVGTEREE